MPGCHLPPARPKPPIPPVPAHWTFPAHPASVRQARHAVTTALPTAFPTELRDELALLTSELVTNAIRHGTRPHDNSPIELVLWTADDHYWLAVTDPGDTLPTTIPTPDPDSSNGRGLLLVEALSATWTVITRPTHGKSVIAGIRLHRD